MNQYFYLKGNKNIIFLFPFSTKYYNIINAKLYTPIPEIHNTFLNLNTTFTLFIVFYKQNNYMNNSILLLIYLFNFI